MELRRGTAREAGMVPGRVDHVRDLCARWVHDGHTPALAIVVARRGVIVLDEVFGVLCPGPDAPPLDRRALFPIASVTKPVTATLVMQLVDDGLLGLNRPAKDYLPELSGDGTDDILVHHLLTHTSGYGWHTDRTMLDHIAKKLNAGFVLPPCPEGRHPTLHESLALRWDVPRVAGVGEVMIYSNHNYELLGEIVQRVARRSLDDLGRARIFAPLGMNDTYWVVPESESSRVVQRAPDLPFGDPDDPLLPFLGGRAQQETPFAGGGIFSTPRDLTVFGQMILDRGRYGSARVLSPAAVAAMTRDQIPGVRAWFLKHKAARASWGYGWAIASPTKWKYFDGSLHALGALNHPGAGGAAFWIDREHELVGAYFEVTTRLTADYEPLWTFDLFQNAITAAVDG